MGGYISGEHMKFRRQRFAENPSPRFLPCVHTARASSSQPLLLNLHSLWRVGKCMWREVSFPTRESPKYCSSRGLQFPVKGDLLKHTNRNIISRINFVLCCKHRRRCPSISHKKDHFKRCLQSYLQNLALHYHNIFQLLIEYPVLWATESQTERHKIGNGFYNISHLSFSEFITKRKFTIIFFVLIVLLYFSLPYSTGLGMVRIYCVILKFPVLFQRHSGSLKPDTETPRSTCSSVCGLRRPWSVTQLESLRTACNTVRTKWTELLLLGRKKIIFSLPF